jgi:hypothetical protein
MRYVWWIWPLGIVIIATAGCAATLLPRRRAQEQARRVAWSDARAAIASAAVSRDAAADSVPEAEKLLLRAELLAGRHGGPGAAGNAAAYAREADQLWRAAYDA